MHDHVSKQAALAISTGDKDKTRELLKVMRYTKKLLGANPNSEEAATIQASYQEHANKLLAESSHWKKKLAGIMLAVLGAVAIGFGIAIVLGTFGLGVGPGAGIAAAGVAGCLAGYSLFAKGRDAQRADYRYSLGHHMQNIIEANEPNVAASYVHV